MFRTSTAVLLTTAYLLAIVVHTACAEGLEPVVVAHRLGPGEKPESLWESPPSISRLCFGRLYHQTEHQCEVRVGYDDQNLYVVFNAEQDSTPVSRSKDGAAEVLNDDSVFVVLDPDRDKLTYYTFAANADGARYAERTRYFIREALNAHWSVKTVKQPGSWTALLTIPFKLIDLDTPKPGDRWLVNFQRTRPGKRAPLPSAWVKVMRDAREIPSRGQLVFGGPAWAKVSLPVIRVATPGKQFVKLTVTRPELAVTDLRLDVIVDGKLSQSVPISSAPGQKELEISYDFPYDGWHDLNLSVVDGADRVLTRTPALPVRIEPYRSRIETCISLLEPLAPESDTLKAELAALRKELGDLSREAYAAEGDSGKWNALKDRVKAAEQSAERIRAACSDFSKCGYALGTESVIRKIMPEKFFQGNFGVPIQISLAKNEFESAQLVVFAYDTDLKGISVTVSDLIGPGNDKIPAANISLNLVDFVRTGEPPYEMDYIGWYPDPIVDLAPFDVPKNTLRPIWITVRTPAAIRAGVYEGTVTVKPSNAPETIVPLEVTVWDFVLPTKPSLKTAFAFSLAELKEWYGKDVTDEQRLAWYEFLLNHRLNPTNIYSKEPMPSLHDMQFCVDRGLNAFTLLSTWGKEGEKLKELLDKIKSYEKPLRDKSWWEMAYVYGFDELGPDKFADLRSTYGAIKKAFPDLPTMTTIAPNEELKGAVDIWVPLTRDYDPAQAKRYTDAGDQVWWYVCCHPVHPYPNYFVDYPAIDPRILCWMNWKYQVPGMLYYMINLWESNRVTEGKGIHPHNDPDALKAIEAGKRWPEVPWNTHTCAGFNGDGHLVYPGPDDRPNSSIRLECIRDGIEDYEYFVILDSLVKKAEKERTHRPALLDAARELLKVRSEVVASLTEYTHEPEVLLAAREELAEMIVRLK